MARRSPNVFGLAFLDAMTCGLGAVVLLFVVIQASAGKRSADLTSDLQGEVDLLEEEVLEGQAGLVVLRNSVADVDDRSARAQGMSRRVLDEIERSREEIATSDASTLALKEHFNRLQADLRSLEEDSRRLSALLPDEEVPGDKVRSFVGDGDRQYLTGFKVGGKRILILVDASASMLDSTIVNILRRRNLPDEEKIRARKWQQALRTVDWVTTQIPVDADFQLYTFAERARPVMEGTDGKWLGGDDREILDRAVAGLRKVVPGGGTSLWHALEAIGKMMPPPDNVILLADGLPTRGHKKPRRAKVSGKARLELFEKAVKSLSLRIPINVILFPMEGDPMAPAAYWQLALATRGSFLVPSEDWP